MCRSTFGESAHGHEEHVLAPSKEADKGYLVRTEKGDLMDSKVMFDNVIATHEVPGEVPPEHATPAEESTGERYMSAPRGYFP